MISPLEDTQWSQVSLKIPEEVPLPQGATQKIAVQLSSYDTAGL